MSAFPACICGAFPPPKLWHCNRDPLVLCVLWGRLFDNMDRLDGLVAERASRPPPLPPTTPAATAAPDVRSQRRELKRWLQQRALSKVTAADVQSPHRRFFDDEGAALAVVAACAELPCNADNEGAEGESESDDDGALSSVGGARQSGPAGSLSLQAVSDVLQQLLARRIMLRVLRAAGSVGTSALLGALGSAALAVPAGFDARGSSGSIP